MSIRNKRINIPLVHCACQKGGAREKTELWTCQRRCSLFFLEYMLPPPLPEEKNGKLWGVLFFILYVAWLVGPTRERERERETHTHTLVCCLAGRPNDGRPQDRRRGVAGGSQLPPSPPPPAHNPEACPTPPAYISVPAQYVYFCTSKASKVSTSLWKPAWPRKESA